MILICPSSYHASLVISKRRYDDLLKLIKFYSLISCWWDHLLVLKWEVINEPLPRLKWDNMFYEIEKEVMGGGGVEIKFCFSDLKMQ